MFKPLLGCLAISLTTALFIASAQCDEPQSPLQLVVKPGDAALSKEIAAKLAARKGLISDANALTPVGLDPALSGATELRPPLTADGLQQMLDNLGYAPQKTKLATGETTFVFTVTRGTWSLRPAVALSADGATLAIMHSLTGKIDGAKVEPLQWQRLLEENVRLAPNVFAINGPTQQLILYHAQRNIDIRPALLRQWLDSSVDVVIGTYDKWKDLPQ